VEAEDRRGGRYDLQPLSSARRSAELRMLPKLVVGRMKGASNIDREHLVKLRSLPAHFDQFSGEVEAGDVLEQAAGASLGPLQFLKTMQAPPLLRTSRHTASASCRVGRPMRAV